MERSKLLFETNDHQIGRWGWVVTCCEQEGLDRPLRVEVGEGHQSKEGEGDGGEVESAWL